MSRIDQQIKVTKIVAACVDLEKVKEKYPKLALYMCRNISIIFLNRSYNRRIFALIFFGDLSRPVRRTVVYNDDLYVLSIGNFHFS